MADLSRIVVVGASVAGYGAIQELRKAGYDGALTLVGAEERLPYDRPPLSKQVLAGDWEPDRVDFRLPDTLDVELRLGSAASALDLGERTLRLASGVDLPYDGLIIATGAAPRQLPGSESIEGVHVLRTLDDCLAVRAAFEQGARVAVVGAGFIGCEVAATARRRGLEVSLIEALPLPLAGALNPEIGQACADLHRAHGVDLRCGVMVEGIDGAQRAERLRLSDGSTVEADVVVVGIGVTPATAWLQSSGLTLDDGVVCDATCMAAPGVYAAGDVARWYNPRYARPMRIEHWTNAMEQGRAAARNLLAGPEDAEPYDHLPYFWSDQYDTSIQLAGSTDGTDEFRVVRGSLEDGEFIALFRSGERIAGLLGFGLARDFARTRRLIAQDDSWEAVIEQLAEASG